MVWLCARSLPKLSSRPHTPWEPRPSPACVWTLWCHGCLSTSQPRRSYFLIMLTDTLIADFLCRAQRLCEPSSSCSFSSYVFFICWSFVSPFAVFLFGSFALLCMFLNLTFLFYFSFSFLVAAFFFPFLSSSMTNFLFFFGIVLSLLFLFMDFYFFVVSFLSLVLFCIVFFFLLFIVSHCFLSFSPSPIPGSSSP